MASVAKSAAVLTRDNVSFLLQGVPCMYRELFFSVKRNPGLPPQEGRVAIVTGGSRGIGLEAVRILLKLGMHIVVGSSSPEAAERQLAALPHQLGGRLEVWPLDLARQQSVRQFAKKFLDSGLSLHVLLCNAGVMFYPRHQLTEDGFETQMAINHLGHFLLQQLLYRRMAESGTAERAARVVNVSSAAHACGGVNFDDLMMTKLYSAKGAYYQSKGAQILCAKHLARAAASVGDHVTCTSLHPGVIYTDLYDYTFIYKMAAPLLKKLWKSPADGAETLVFACVSPESEGLTGVHLENSAVYGAAAYTEDEARQRRMWDSSLRLCGLAHQAPAEAGDGAAGDAGQ